MSDLFTRNDRFIIFKHSRRCPLSAQAYREVQEYKKEGVLPVVLIDVIAEPELKLQIAETYGVTHESPQVLLIDQQECIGHHDHYDVTVENLFGFEQ